MAYLRRGAGQGLPQGFASRHAGPGGAPAPTYVVSSATPAVLRSLCCSRCPARHCSQLSAVATASKQHPRARLPARASLCSEWPHSAAASVRQAEGALPASAGRQAVLVAGTGERLVELLWRLSVHALRIACRTECASVRHNHSYIVCAEHGKGRRASRTYSHARARHARACIPHTRALTRIGFAQTPHATPLP